MTDDEIKAAASRITFDQQIACVRRELALRKNVYRGFVARGKMKQEEADKELTAMQAVHDSLMVLALINELRTPEGASVTLCCNNPGDFAGPNCIVEVTDSFTNWVEKAFYGETLLEALQAAKTARDKGVQ